MKKILVIIYTTITVLMVNSNDAFVTIAGGQLNLTEVNKYISIVKEDLTIEIKDENYSVDIVYNFYNNGKTIKLKTAFPQYKTYITSSDNFKIKNFKIEYGDGRNIDYLFDSTLTQLSERQYIDGWYFKDIEFVGNAKTEIHISYDSIYGAAAGSLRATYLLGTGRTWLGPIEELNLNIINKSKYWINRLMIENIDDYKYTNTEDGLYNINLGQHEPDLYEEINVLLQKNPTYNHSVVSFYDSYWLDSVQVKAEKLRFLSSNQLRILRNAIYANRGYKFKSSDLDEFFSNQYWYEIDENFSETVFNDIERNNIRTIYNYEYQQKNKRLVDILINNK